MIQLSNCDKCGHLVAHNNDAMRLDYVAIMQEKYGVDYVPGETDTWHDTAFLSHGGRHLLPLVEDGKVVCEGSPSRAQYIGQPLDRRFPYRPDLECRYRNAYARLQSDTDI